MKVFAGLSAFCLALYAGALRNPFLWDDVGYLAHVPVYRDWRNIAVLWRPAEYFGRTGHFNYRPVFVAGCFLNYQLWQLRPWGWRLFDLALYSLTCFLVWKLVLRLTSNLRAAWAAALLFAAFPAHHETVVCTTLMHDMECTLFFLLALLGDLGSNSRLRRWTPVFYGLALFSKEMALMYLPLVAAYQYLLAPAEERLGARDAARRYAGHAAVTVVYLAVRFFWIKNPLAASVLYNGGTFWTNLLTVPKVFLIEWKMLLIPYPLSIDYVVSPISTPGDPWMLGGAALAAGCAAALWVLRRRSPLAAFGLAWILITLVPVLNLTPIPGVFSERYLFLPSVGLALFIAAAASALSRRAAVAGVVALLAAYTTVVIRRHKDWRDGLSLYGATVRVQPDSGAAHAGLAKEYETRDRPDLAAAEYLEAIRVEPRKVMPYNNLGLLYKNAGRTGEAETWYRAAIALDPRYAEARNNLGIIEDERGALQEAERDYRLATELSPGFSEAYTNLGGALEALGRTDEAVEAHRAAIRLAPDFAEAHGNLGNVYLRKGLNDAAIAEFETAARLKPNLAQAYNGLALAYKAKGDLQKAAEILEALTRAAPNYARGRANLEIVRAELAARRR